MGFIERYVDFITATTDAPEDYQEACALFLLSTMCGRHFLFFSIPDANIFVKPGSGGDEGGRFLNLWFILIGKSRVMRKSTVVKRAYNIIKEICPELILPEDFTPQAFISVMQGKTSGGHTNASWINDEISGFFEQLQKADFMTATDTLLSRMYDGRTYTRQTIVRGAETVENPNVTAFLASTEYLPSLFEEAKMRQGFLNRFIYVPIEKKTRLSLRRALTQAEQKEVEDIKLWLEAVWERNQQVSTLVVISHQAQPIYDDHEIAVEDRIFREDMGIIEGYFGNLPNFLIRVSALHRISRMTLAEVVNYKRPYLEIDVEDIEWGIKYCDKIWKWFEKVIKMMRTAYKSREVLVDTNLLELVYDIILEKGSTGEDVTRTYIYRKANLVAKKLNEVLGTLIVQGRIEQDTVPGKTGTKTITIYRII